MSFMMLIHPFGFQVLVLARHWAHGSLLAKVRKSEPGMDVEHLRHLQTLFVQ